MIIRQLENTYNTNSNLGAHISILRHFLLLAFLSDHSESKMSALWELQNLDDTHFPSSLWSAGQESDWKASLLGCGDVHTPVSTRRSLPLLCNRVHLGFLLCVLPADSSGWELARAPLRKGFIWPGFVSLSRALRRGSLVCVRQQIGMWWESVARSKEHAVKELVTCAVSMHSLTRGQTCGSSREGTPKGVNENLRM